MIEKRCFSEGEQSQQQLSALAPMDQLERGRPLEGAPGLACSRYCDVEEGALLRRMGVRDYQGLSSSVQQASLRTQAVLIAVSRKCVTSCGNGSTSSSLRYGEATRGKQKRRRRG